LILVTGGAGFIGSHLVDHLVSMRAKVKVVDNLSSGRIENLAQHRDSQNVEIVIGDLKDREICINVVKDVEVVFHFAANPEVRVSTIDPETHFRENIVATFNLLEAMKRRDVKVIVFASSSSVYGEPEEIPVKEDAPIRPVSVYGATKAACETPIHAYTRLYGFKAVIFRYANVVGPRLRHGVIYDFLQKLKNNPHKLEILGDGTQIRSFIYVDDAVEATILAYQKSRSRFEIYNVASEDWITIKDVADIVVKTLNLRNVKYILKPVAHGVGWLGDVKKIALDISKLKSLGWKPKLSSREAVAKTVKDLSKEILR